MKFQKPSEDSIINKYKFQIGGFIILIILITLAVIYLKPKKTDCVVGIWSECNNNKQTRTVTQATNGGTTCTPEQNATEQICSNVQKKPTIQEILNSLTQEEKESLTKYDLDLIIYEELKPLIDEKLDLLLLEEKKLLTKQELDSIIEQDVNLLMRQEVIEEIKSLIQKKLDLLVLEEKKLLTKQELELLIQEAMEEIKSTSDIQQASPTSGTQQASLTNGTQQASPTNGTQQAPIIATNCIIGDWGVCDGTKKTRTVIQATNGGIACTAPDNVTEQACSNLVTVYEHINYQGVSSSLNVGYYNIGQMGIGNDVISSVRVPSGFKVTLYEHNNGGNTLVLYADEPDLSNKSFNETVSTINIERT